MSAVVGRSVGRTRTCACGYCYAHNGHKARGSVHVRSLVLRRHLCLPDGRTRTSIKLQNIRGKSIDSARVMLVSTGPLLARSELLPRVRRCKNGLTKDEKSPRLPSHLM